jgi:hypothetical protein
MKFYKFMQNNTGGSFEVNHSVSVQVYIQAPNANQANIRAQQIGIYFDGVDRHLDCDCCGDRWYRASEGDVFDDPDDDKYISMLWVQEGFAYAHIYYADGSAQERKLNPRLTQE